VSRSPLAAPGLAIALALLAAACGGNVNVGTGGAGGSGAAGGGTTSAGGAGSGGALPGGDCKTNADCPAGGECAELTPGGYKVCLSFPKEATVCTNGMPIADQCCKTADCKKGKCYLSTDVPMCGSFDPVYNECAADACAGDADCGPQAICAPAGAYGPVRRCIAAYCKTSAECGAKPGGVCAPIDNPCCAVPVGLACVYPGGCKKQQDCKSTQSCDIDVPTKTAACADQAVGCPL
jgi:hypothetical protein